MRVKRPNPGPNVEGEPSAQPLAAPQQASGKGEETAQPQVEAANVTDVSEQSSPVSTGKLNKHELQQNGQLEDVQVHRSKLSVLQIALIAGIICSTAILTYSLFNSSPNYSPQQVKAEVNTFTAQRDENEEKKSETTYANSSVSAVEDESSEPLSLQVAENYYRAKDYDKAYDVYQRLREKLTGQDYEMTRDFLLLKMGLCLERKGETDNANQLFKKAALSRSVVTAILANFRSSLMELRLGQYLNARTRAYKTMALTGAVVSDYEWASVLERDCAFIVSEAITRQVLMFCDADSQLPQELWSQESEQGAASLTGTEAALTELTDLKSGSPGKIQNKLNTGVDKLNKGLLIPQVQAIEQTGINVLNRWQVCCSGPGIDELLVRFAANASLDMKWLRPEHNDSKSKSARGERVESAPSGAKWNRSVTLYLPSATAQQVVATAAGAVGLLAQLDEAELPPEILSETHPVKGTIIVSDPAEYSSLSQHTKILAEHAMWLWRKLLLMYGDDKRMANAHFALGILEGQSGRIAEAIAEYKLVSARYSKTALAPFALLRSSRLKTSLLDYAGASRDLKELIEQYPDNELVSRAHFELAETTMKAGQFEQACSLYRKAFNLGFSTQFSAVAALGAGRCYYQMEDFESAKRWLIRYIEMIGAQKDAAKHEKETADSYTAYFLLGKTYLALGNLEAACSALQRTATLAVTGDNYFEALTTLVETHIKQDNFIEALAVIANARDRPFSQGQSTKLLILKSRALQGMGLADQALTALCDRERYVADPQLRAGIIIEIARCGVSEGKLDLAKDRLTEGLSLLEAGPEAQAVSLELAEVCLKLGEDQQAITICNRVIDSTQSGEERQTVDESLRRKASEILASAYSRQHDLDKAAQVILMVSKFK
jgi:tetratricopeptide (TPR) repeat protein